jgi:chorismate lyase/3-hydroxybenzoate synthase
MNPVPARSTPRVHRLRRQPESAPMVDYLPEVSEVEDTADGGALADIGYGEAHWRDAADPRRIVIGSPPVGPAMREVWSLTDRPTEAGWAGDIGYVLGGDFLFAHLLAAEHAGTDLAAITRAAYGRLLAFVRASPCPALLRMWNYVARINDHEHGIERYQALCKGRAQAFAETSLPAGCFPAATAIGSPGPGLSVHLLAGRHRGSPIENPRQLSAYHYPLTYGPRPPSFARAMCYVGPGRRRELAISGTASIVGHLTMHPRDLHLQLRETLRNLSTLLARAGAAVGHSGDTQLLLKVYLREPSMAAAVEPALRAWAGPIARILFLHGAICRRELDIEIEAHCSVRSPATRPQRQRVPVNH